MEELCGTCRASRGLGPLIVDDPAPHPEQAPLAVGGDLHVPVLVTFLDRGEEMLAAVLDPLDRLSEQEGGGDGRRLVGVEDVLAAEPAAHVRDDDAHPVLVGAEQLHELVADAVRRLGRDPHRHVVRLCLGPRDDPPGLDGVRAPAVLLERDGEDVGRGGERGAAVAVFGAYFLDDVVARVAMRGGGAGGERVPAVGDRRERLVLDVHQRCRVLRRVARIGDDDGDGFADVHRLVFRHHQWLRRLGKVPGAMVGRDDVGGEDRGQVRPGEHRPHPGKLARGGGIDGHDTGMGMGAAHEGGLQQPGHAEVVDVAALPGEQRFVLEALDGGADEAGAHGSVSASAAVKR